LQQQFAGYEVKKLDARVLVPVRMGSLSRFELGIVSVQLPVLRKKVQALEMIGRMACAGCFRKSQALSLSDYFEYRFRLGIEEVFQPHAEDESDAKKSRQSWVHEVALKLR
jgi:hypothetical protein